ncbi:Non-specific serine/threonine protein kinase [Handroanthus impetiginosus]|uniref:Non-specific serine/threonine protein kinase n=1 Tax=Handroanthus impetiginosus TaxID=429701 RepID=A0A2G9I2H7_9LAMI|nr:Non-specific serine/threonine protein kinase [Handroanthus impetiginosus]
MDETYTSMVKWVLLLLVMLNLKAFAQDQPDSWIGIDCGANRSTTTNGILWQPDDTFIQTGTNHLIPNQNQSLAILNTLRVFTQQNKNCYTLPAQTEDRYFLRAIFFYANYDGLSRPPTFDLQIDGNKWVTIVSSSTEVLYYEILYLSQRPNISVCLARTQNEQFPFISSLEAWKIPSTMYTRMSQNSAWLNSYRYNYDQPDSWIGIDCGANRSTTTNGILWQPDDTFIQTGTNHLIPNQNQSLAILNTLRVFTQQNKNCYTLPAQTEDRYFLRAIFFYANYDGLSRPPTFDLQIDGNKWVTIVSSSTEVLYYEILYLSQRPNISVCLARTQNEQFPFISSLEAWKIPSTMYTRMSQNSAWLNSYRYNYDKQILRQPCLMRLSVRKLKFSQIVETYLNRYPGDSYNRIWEPKYVPGYVNTTADPGTDIYDHSDDSPPDSAILDAIEAQNGTSLFLSFNPVKPITPIVIVAYFTEMQSNLSGMRSFDIYVDDKSVDTVTPDYNTCTAKEVLVQALNSSLTIELRPTATTLLPPGISAIEIYTASDPLVTSGTDPDDLNGLAALTSMFDQLKGWSGEPCLPEDFVWQWLSCRRTNPPRVSSINLSGYGLNGNLSDFSQMQALEDIDLSNNRLSGQIPDFLGQLPILKKLNLSYNDFSGTLPSSICNNRGLTYKIDGNPKLDPSCKEANPPSNSPSKPSSLPTSAIIGIVIAIVIVMAIIVWFIRRRLRLRQNQNQNQNQNQDQNQNQNQNQPTRPEIGNGFVQDSFTRPPSIDQLIRPQHTISPTEPISDEEEDCVPVSTINMNPNAETMVPEIDIHELEELVDEHANVSCYANYQTSGEHFGVDASSSDQSMQPDLDLEELGEIVKHTKER